MKYLLLFSSILLMFLMLFSPTYYITYKIILLFIIIIVIIGEIIFKNNGLINLSKSIIYWTIFLSIISSLYIVYGLYNNNPGALNLATIHLIYPWLFLVLIASINTKKRLEIIFTAIVFITLMIEIYGLLYLLTTMGFLPDILFPDIYIGQNINISNGGISFGFPALGTLLFSLPFIFTKICMPQNNSKNNTQFLYWITFILGIGILILSGRRALVTIVLLTPVIVFIFTLIISKKSSKKILINLVISMLSVLVFSILSLYVFRYYLAFDFKIFKEMLISGFNFTTNDISSDSYIRNLQFNVLLEEWSKQPLFGHGLGATTNALVRNFEFPWAFELQYMSYLFNIGLVGFIIFASSFIWIITKSIIFMKKETDSVYFILPSMVGMISFLIANATNPYLSKFDFMWTIFLPISIINYYLIQKENKVLKEC